MQCKEKWTLVFLTMAIYSKSFVGVTLATSLTISVTLVNYLLSFNYAAPPQTAAYWHVMLNGSFDYQIFIFLIINPILIEKRRLYWLQLAKNGKAGIIFQCIPAPQTCPTKWSHILTTFLNSMLLESNLQSQILGSEFQDLLLQKKADFSAYFDIWYIDWKTTRCTL